MQYFDFHFITSIFSLDLATERYGNKALLYLSKVMSVIEWAPEESGLFYTFG